MSFRVWARQWVTVYTSDSDGELGQRECEDHQKLDYDGFVRDDEWRIDLPSKDWPASLLLRLPVVVAEFRSAVEAEDFRMKWESRHGGHPETAQLGTERDRELDNYGKRKLRT